MRADTISRLAHARNSAKDAGKTATTRATGEVAPTTGLAGPRVEIDGPEGVTPLALGASSRAGLLEAWPIVGTSRIPMTAPVGLLWLILDRGEVGDYSTGNRTTPARSEVRLAPDFSEVRSMSSDFLGRLLKIGKKLEGVGVKLKLENLQPDLLEFFRITWLDRVIEIDR